MPWYISHIIIYPGRSIPPFWTSTVVLKYSSFITASELVLSLEMLSLGGMLFDPFHIKYLRLFTGYGTILALLARFSRLLCRSTGFQRVPSSRSRIWKPYPPASRKFLMVKFSNVQCWGLVFVAGNRGIKRSSRSIDVAGAAVLLHRYVSHRTVRLVIRGLSQSHGSSAISKHFQSNLTLRFALIRFLDNEYHGML